MFLFIGKSLVGKEKAIQTAEKENLKSNPDPVFFISLVGVNREGFVDEHEHLFDIYSKEYDFFGTDVKVISAQDLWEFYQLHDKLADRNEIEFYKLIKLFVGQYPNGHYVLDECPFPVNGK